MSIMDIMVQIGRNVKYDDYGRVTIPAQLAEMLNLVKGLDEVSWNVSDGRVYLTKVTKSYRGLDFEAEEIEAKLRDYEKQYIDDFRADSELSPEELEAKAREEYERDKAAREALLNSKKN